MFPMPEAHAIVPATISYIAALRGVKPRPPTDPFAWASFACTGGEHLICLAASNPNGTFFGLMNSEGDVRTASAMATERNVRNVHFTTSPSDLPPLDIMTCHETAMPLSSAERDAFANLAARTLKPGGACVWLYQAYATPDDTLRFLVSELSPDMTVEQAREFLHELKALGPTYFANHPFAAAALDRAIAAGSPDEFFATCLGGTAPHSGTLTAMEAMLPRGFAFAGDARIAANYMEMATPLSAHSVLDACRNHLLFEPIKDFAMQRLTRADIWVRLPVEQTEDPAALFGGFVFGLASSPAETLPSFAMVGDQRISLTTEPYASLLGIMALLPASIGDFLSHKDTQGAAPGDIIAALQTLVACGLVIPMRAGYRGSTKGGINRPRWALPYNSFLDNASITTPRVALASAIVGAPVTLSAREALVLQAVNRVGLEDSASALLLELARVAANPALAAQIMDVAEPTSDVARDMIRNTVQQSLIRWLSYGLLAA